MSVRASGPAAQAFRPRMPSSPAFRVAAPTSAVRAGASANRPGVPAQIGGANNRLPPGPKPPPSSPASAALSEDRQQLQLAGAVGLEYIEQIRTDQRGAASVQFHCRLCDCRFTDPQARDLHVKGRRHRLQYKRKVDPRLDVDAKPSIKARRTQDSTGSVACSVSGSLTASNVAAAQAAARIRRMEDQRLRELQALEWSNFTGCRTIGFWGGGSGPNRRPETNDDRHVLAKHSSVYPTEAELQSVQQLVTRCERALKLVSDQLSAEENPAPLRGVMRVGVLAKGLLLHGDLSTQLVLLCANRPTRTLRDRIMHLLPGYLEQANEVDAKNLPEVDEEQKQQLEVRLDEEEGSLLIVSPDGELTCSVCLTSPAVREESTEDNPEPEDMLDKEKCLESLAALRQAKWFQAKASSLQSCVVVVRVLRDLCQRLPVWNPLPEWAMELLVERSISSFEGSLSPGEALRRVMECLSTGILLPGGSGLRDPCEKLPIDAAATLSTQEREDLTASAQRAMRFIAFRQVHRVLDMEPLAPPSATANSTATNASSASSATGASAVKRPAPATTAPSTDKTTSAGVPPKQARKP